MPSAALLRTYAFERGAHESLVATLSALLAAEPPPRIVLSHEHRSRLPSDELSSWDEGDVILAHFRQAAAAANLELEQLSSELPRVHEVQVGIGLEAVSREISIIEVRAAGSHRGDRTSRLTTSG